MVSDIVHFLRKTAMRLWLNSDKMQLSDVARKNGELFKKTVAICKRLWYTILQ